MKKEKYTIEYSLNNISPSVLWTYIGTVNGLADWFADKVVADGKHFTFYWNKSPQEAIQTTFRAGSFIRFKWCDEDLIVKPTLNSVSMLPNLQEMLFSRLPILHIPKKKKIV